MSVYSDLITAVKVRVDTVSNVGTTHAYQRYNANWSDHLDQFKATIGGVVQIRGWIVTMDGGQPIVGMMTDSRFGAIRRTYNLVVIGILGLSDSTNTETTFLNLMEEVMNALDGRDDLGVTGAEMYGSGPASLKLYDIRQFGSVLCHYCEISLPVETERAVAYA